MLARSLLLLSLLTSSSTMHAQDVEAKRKLAMAGQALGKALATHDQAALEKLWSPQMIVNGPSNTVLTRAEVLEGMKNGQLDYETGYKTTVEKVEFIGNVAVTMGEDSYTPAFGLTKANCCIVALLMSGSTTMATG